MYGVRLRELRNSKNWSIEEVADKICVGSSTYGGYETEYRKPPINNLIKLSRLYDVSVDYILGLSDEKKIEEVETNAYEYLKKGDLNWNGIPLSDDELKPIRDLLEVVVRDRIPKNSRKV